MNKLIFILLPIMLVLFVITAFAEDICDGIDDCNDKIEELTKKVNELSNRGQSLAGEIAYMDSQVNLTQLRIQNSIAKIAKTTKDIEKLGNNIEEIRNRLTKLELSIAYQKKILDARLRSRYKIQESSLIMVLFGSDNLNKIIQKTEYLQFLELQDNKMLVEMDKTKTAYNKQRDIFQDKKNESEILKANLEKEKANLDSYKVTLENQKQEKKNLLEATQNDEAKYQRLLEEARRELAQITGAVSVLKGTAGENVKKGDRIGTQGNSGRSSGPHLHFGVYRYSSFAQIDGWNWYYSNTVDPAKILESKLVQWSSCEDTTKSIGRGSWDWPLKGSVIITNSYGNNCYKYSYNGGNIHPAYDMVGPSGSPVYAVKDGIAYTCRNCLGDGGNGVFIFHKDNYMTIYWHLR